MWIGIDCVNKKNEIIELLQFIKFEEMNLKELEEVESFHLLEDQILLSLKSMKNEIINNVKI